MPYSIPLCRFPSAKCYAAPLMDFDATAPEGSIIGLIGEDGSGKTRLLRLAAGIDQPESGAVERPESARLLGPLDALNLAPAPLLLIDGTLANHDALVRERAAVALDRMRRNGSTIFLVSHDEELLPRLADEIWWLHEGRLAGRGDPAETLAGYRRHIAQRVRAWGDRGERAAVSAHAARRWARGDRRDRDYRRNRDKPPLCGAAASWHWSRCAFGFMPAVEAPVVGIMIRTRVGLNVYGTNTELERLALGPRADGRYARDLIRIPRRPLPGRLHLDRGFARPRRRLARLAGGCVAFSVTDDRYTAGVANLHATVTWVPIE